MKLSVFQRLSEQFSELCATRKKIDIIDIQNTMRTAGRAFWMAISSGQIDLGQVPSWFKEKPKKDNLCSWDLYWWCVVAWLIRKKPDSGIFCSPTVKKMKLKKEMLGLSLRKYLINEKQLFRNEYRKVCLRLATASKTACQYLIDIFDNIQDKTTTPEDLVDLTKALEQVNISRTQVKRDIYSGKIKSYRKNPKGKHIVSLSAMKNSYLLQKDAKSK